ncbi:MAG: hypothetical protein SGI73_21475 [Chloroflexota bacterium]|nr:hypothetical protein [Chloroflexota bacterium]
MMDDLFKPPDRIPVDSLGVPLEPPTRAVSDEPPESPSDGEQDSDSDADKRATAELPPSERRGRARERVAKRRATRGAIPNPNPFAPTRATGELDAALSDAVRVSDEHPAASMLPPRPNAPPSRFALPASGKPASARRVSARRRLDSPLARLAAIRLPFSRTILIGVGSVLFVVAVVFALGLVRNRPTQSADNALWVGDEWTAAAPDATQLTAWVENLRAHQVGTVFAWVSQLTPERAWFGEANFEATAAFVSAFKAAYPDARLYGWIFVPVDGVSLQLDDAARMQIADMARRVIDEMDFDGVLLHVDPVVNADEGYLSLLRVVRTAIGDAPLAVAVPPDWTPLGANVPQPPLIAPGTMWDSTYKQRVVLLVDELVVQTYNTGFSNPTEYSAWIAHQVGSFTNAIAALEVDVDVYIGVPTYDADPPRYNPAVENIASAVQGLRDGMGAAGESARFLRGAAVYANWTTEADEWDDFRREWLER